MHGFPARAAAMAPSTLRGRDRRLGDLDAERRERIVDRVDDRGRRGDRAALAYALLPELRIRRRRLHVHDAHGRHLGRARQDVVRERRGERLALGVVGHLLVERGADALRGAAVDLAVHHHRIDERAAILDDHVVEYLDVAGLGVHRHGHGMAGIAERARVDLRLVARHGLEAGGIRVGRQELRLPVPACAPLRPASCAGRCPSTLDAAVAQLQLRGLHAQQVRRDVSSRAPPISLHAVATAPPDITMQREPHVPVEYGVSAVSP